MTILETEAETIHSEGGPKAKGLEEALRVLARIIARQIGLVQGSSEELQDQEVDQEEVNS